MWRLAALAVALAAVTGFGVSTMSDRAIAMGFCNCCDGGLTQSCGEACAATSLAPGLCPAIVDYESTGATSQGANPLNGMSLRDLALGDPTPWRLELYRRFMERSRRQAVASYKKAMRQLKRHQMAPADFDKAAALYREALVNYYHGIRAYLNRVGTKSD